MPKYFTPSFEKLPLYLLQFFTPENSIQYSYFYAEYNINVLWDCNL